MPIIINIGIIEIFSIMLTGIYATYATGIIVYINSLTVLLKISSGYVDISVNIDSVVCDMASDLPNQNASDPVIIAMLTSINPPVIDKKVNNKKFNGVIPYMNNII